MWGHADILTTHNRGTGCRLSHEVIKLICFIEKYFYLCIAKNKLKLLVLHKKWTDEIS